MTKRTQQSFASEIKSEIANLFIDAPRAIAKYPLWRQLITWPLYIGLVILIVTISLIALLFLVGSVIRLLG